MNVILEMVSVLVPQNVICGAELVQPICWHVSYYKRHSDAKEIRFYFYLPWKNDIDLLPASFLVLFPSICM
jgi:hypothetical protein